MGASAGGLDAFKRFFAAMPADSGVAFVLVPHLDPAHESLMVELLARHTAVPVLEAKNDMPVEANRVYIVPPNKYITIHAGVLRLTGPVERRTSQTTIDRFLRTLADDQQERAICIILSGTGAHGTLGLKDVKAAGGMAMVQDPVTAEYDRMPQSAIATGLADYVLPVEQMPEALIKYVRHAYVNGGKTIEGAPEAGDYLSQVLALLRAHTRFDFRSYRSRMLARRIERRMGLNHVDSIAKYLAFLRDQPDELKQLTKDLFISVTSFFRDPEAIEQLASQVIAPLVESKEPDAAIRVWVPGCSTGEEAYSLVILFLEQLAAAKKNCPLQVFATDVDQDSLEVARHGIYPESIAADVLPERLARYFTRVDESSYQVSKQVREPVIIAPQNLISDAPFSKIDLISCRNLLIYLESEVQKKVVALMHFALNEGGYLFLGPSETVGRQIDLFEPVSKKWRIFGRIGPSRPERVEFPIGTRTSQAGQAQSAGEPGGERPLSFGELTQRLVVEELGPAAVLINRKYEILYFLGATSRYLDLPTGEPTKDLMTMAREGLRNKLRAAVHRTVRENAPVVLSDVQVKRNGSYRAITVTVKPVPAPRSEGLLLVIFQERPETLPVAPASASEEPLVQQLENELHAAKEDLQTTIEEMERSNEEFKASNEEVMSMNEELQSANEELETSKEELQSLNEELTTVNNQLHDKVDELESANNDMANLLNCTDVATVFLDPELRIKRFTPAATDLFNFVALDLGRPLGDITARFADLDLVGDIQQVLRQLAPREKEVSSQEGRWWSRRVVPYRTRDNRVEGVVITFVDVTERKQAVDTVVRRLATIVENSADAILSKDLDGTIRTWNQGAERLYGYTHAEAVGQSVELIVPRERRDELATIMAKIRRGESIERLETERLCKYGQRIAVSLTVSPIRDEGGTVVSASAMAHDITARKQADDARRVSEERLRAVMNAAADAIINIDPTGIIQSVNPAAERMFGYTASEMIGQNVKMLMPAPYREEHDGYLASYLRTGEKHIIGIGREVEAVRKDGTTFPVDLAVSEVNQPRLFTGIIRDNSKRKSLEREVLEIATLEQQRIGQELHDTAAQELTALGLLADSLMPTLEDKSPTEARIATKMAEGIKRVLGQVRAISRGLIRVEVDSEGLMAALAELAASTSEVHGVACTFVCKNPVYLRDNQTATQLYSIAREAVTNALKHAQAHNITISLQSDGQSVRLQVQDDGTGLPSPPLDTKGMGLKIMHYRAGLIDAHLSIGTTEPRGTVVTCTYHRGARHGQAQDQDNPSGSKGPGRR
jgi:two-component system CheB/CheR fusion protein